MTFEELKRRAEMFYLDKEKNIKIPFSDGAFERTVEPPHLMFTDIDTNNVPADNKVIYETYNSRLELTTDYRDRRLEKRIKEEILKDVYYKEIITYISNEKIWNVSYFFETK